MVVIIAPLMGCMCPVCLGLRCSGLTDIGAMVQDSQGRVIAPCQHDGDGYERPAGPWDDNQKVEDEPDEEVPTHSGRG